MRVVWVLGAGFSKPLGGPLLDDLFGEQLYRQILRAFPDESCAGLRRAVELAHRWYGRQQTDPQRERGSWPGPWNDPESFLDVIDSAYALFAAGQGDEGLEESIRAALCGDVPESVGLSQIAASIRRYFAAACHAFVVNTIGASEAWDPYIRWARSLRPGDTVLTFNYDLIPEHLEDAAKEGRVFGTEAPLRVFTPQQIEDGELKDDRGSVPVIKLHGSLNWRIARQQARGKNQITNIEAVPPGPQVLRLLGSIQTQIAIASPGMAKRQATESYLQPLWREAKKRLGLAHVIVFVGYRFPESDNVAKQSILGAIPNRGGDGPITIHTVLGPDLNKPDPQRLRGLLQWATSMRDLRDGYPPEPPRDEDGRPPQDRDGVSIFSQPMYCQDFFAVFSRQSLHAWWKWKHYMGNT